MKLFSVKELVEGEKFIHAIFNFAYCLRGIKVGLLLLPLAWESIYEEWQTGNKVLGTRIPAVSLFVGTGFLTCDKQVIKLNCWREPVGCVTIVELFAQRKRAARIKVL